MKRFLFFAVAAVLFAACSKDALDEQQGIQNIVDEAPATLTVGFEDDETRIQLNEAQKTVWTKDDIVSVFYLSDANQKWQYTGETGARTADLTCVDAGEATMETQRVVVVYPYNANYYFNTETYNVQASLPATQTYLKDSYGLDGNIMISQSEYNNISLKNVCGWLKLQLTGDGEKVKSITLRGNNGEQVAGELYINSADATATLASEAGDAGEDDGENETGGAGGNLVFEDTVLTEVTLNCVDGVTLGAEATAFYIALPPQTFTRGITVDITAVDGSAMTKTTDNEVVIERNHIKPMTAFGYNGVFKPANNEIYYTNGSTTEPTAPNKPAAFGNATIQSNTYDAEKECWVITFNKDVTKIGDWAFDGYKTDCNKLTSVTIPDSVTTIGYGAFWGCTSLTSVTIGDSVTTIGTEAFNKCSSLTSVTIPDSVTTIGNSAFGGCESLTSVTIPDSVTTIGNSAFSGCESLTSVTIPDSVTTIGDYAFGYCYSLTSVTIGDSVTTIGGGAFYYCNSLTSVTIPDSVTTIGKSAFYKCTSLTSVTIGDSVTTIGEQAFEYCSSLTSIIIPDSVRTIGKSAFWGCGSLTSVTIPDSVTTIGKSAFRGCSSLTSVTIPDSVTTIGEYAFYLCRSLTSVTIPDSVTTIGESAFDWCTSLTSVTIPDSVTTIGKSVFLFCTSLTSVTIPDSVTTIGEGAFAYCTSLEEFKGKFAADGGRCLIMDNTIIAYAEASGTTYTIPDSVTTIGRSAFADCTSLTSVTIGNSVTTIGAYAFYDCKSLKTVYCKPTTPPTGGSNMFYNNASDRKIYVPASDNDSIINAYKAKQYWRDYKNDIFEEE